MMGTVITRPHAIKTLFPILLAAAPLVRAAAEPPASRPAAKPTTRSEPRADQPRVLLRPADVARLQAHCGILVPQGASYATHGSDYRRITQWVDRNLDLPLED